MEQYFHHRDHCTEPIDIDMVMGPNVPERFFFLRPLGVRVADVGTTGVQYNIDLLCTIHTVCSRISEGSFC